jgi:hypothetical protein
MGYWRDYLRGQWSIFPPSIFSPIGEHHGYEDAHKSRGPSSEEDLGEQLSQWGKFLGIVAVGTAAVISRFELLTAGIAFALAAGAGATALYTSKTRSKLSAATAALPIIVATGFALSEIFSAHDAEGLFPGSTTWNQTTISLMNLTGIAVTESLAILAWRRAAILCKKSEFWLKTFRRATIIATVIFGSSVSTYHKPIETTKIPPSASAAAMDTQTQHRSSFFESWNAKILRKPFQVTLYGLV